MPKHNYIQLAKAEYAEFCELFKGKNLEEVHAICAEKELSHYTYSEESIMDINFKHLLCTLYDNGTVADFVEIYDDLGNIIETYYFNK